MTREERDEIVRNVLEYLNRTEMRCTYEAVAELLGAHPIQVGRYLGARRRYASWVVSKGNGMPTDYSKERRHPNLERCNDIITKGDELLKRMVGAASQKR